MRNIEIVSLVYSWAYIIHHALKEFTVDYEHAPNLYTYVYFHISFHINYIIIVFK